MGKPNRERCQTEKQLEFFISKVYFLGVKMRTSKLMCFLQCFSNISLMCCRCIVLLCVLLLFLLFVYIVLLHRKFFKVFSKYAKSNWITQIRIPPLSCTSPVDAPNMVSPMFLPYLFFDPLLLHTYPI